MQIKSFFQTMKDGYEIWVNRWLPDTEEETKGIVCLHHGLAEHAMRYDRLGSILSENGYGLVSFDARGHGHSADNAIMNNTGDYGIISKKNGHKIIVSDLLEVITKTKEDFPKNKIILAGHSFGSFVTQNFIEQNSQLLDGCILIGTSGPNPIIPLGLFVGKIVKAFRGKTREAKLLSKLAFGPYNNKIKDRKTEYDWLSANEANVQMYEMDRWCGIPLSNSFFCDLFTLIKNMSKTKNINAISKDLPVIMLYGADDPVGNYGKSINKLFNLYEKAGIKNIEIKAYPGNRHEILNDNDKETVEKDILTWLDSICVQA